MGKYRGPVCRLCRREKVKLFLKGLRCYTEKCAVDKRPFAPGQHGKSRRMKFSDYGLQLREKQKAKRIYGLMEKQFRFYFKKAEQSKGVTGEKLLEFLERRLDNTVFRLMFTLTRREARQMVTNGCVYVNDHKVNKPSYLVETGDAIQLKCSEKQKQKIKELIDMSKDRTTPKWLKVDATNFKGEIVGIPDRADVGFPIKDQLIIELYSK